jgi:UDPglucose--hexose-1-phosphate uridylyltransferase
MNINRPHRRLNLLTGQWVLVSPHRTQRPWLGQVEKTASETLPEYDPNCYLCPENIRSTGQKNPSYTGTYIFDNDFAALLPSEGEHGEPLGMTTGMFVAEQEVGVCRVVCFSPRHNLSLPIMAQSDVENVIVAWAGQTTELGSRDEIGYVQVFENNGAMMGASNPHPHSQIWATGHLPNEINTEQSMQEQYLKEKGNCLLCDYLLAERASGERIVAANAYFTALIPYWAVWPFEVMLLAHRHCGSLSDLTPAEVSGLADIMQQITTRYDNLFEVSFPYSMGFHQSPTDGGKYPGWHLHAHYYPPLLRSATVRKFMVGFEMLGMPQRDLTPETAAQRLKELSGVHYKKR